MISGHYIPKIGSIILQNNEEILAKGLKANKTIPLGLFSIIFQI